MHLLTCMACVQVRHKPSMHLVASGRCGEAEAEAFGAEAGEGAGEASRHEGERQTAAALKRVSAFLADNDIYFNGAGEEGLPSVEQSWSVNHLDKRYRAQNWKTIDGLASIMRDYDAIALEVHGETGPASPLHLPCISPASRVHLHIGMADVLQVGDADNVSARTTEVTVTPGRSPLLVELPIGPSAGKVHLAMRSSMHPLHAYTCIQLTHACAPRPARCTSPCATPSAAPATP